MSISDSVQSIRDRFELWATQANTNIGFNALDVKTLLDALRSPRESESIDTYESAKPSLCFPSVWTKEDFLGLQVGLKPPGCLGDHLIGKHVLVRSYAEGVHAGILSQRFGQEVILKKARRIWKWHGAFTLSELSQTGLDPKQSRVAVEMPEILILKAESILPLTEEAISSIAKAGPNGS